MNKILKIITACFVLPVSFLCANSQEAQDEKQNDCCCVENSFGYLNIGVGPLPELVPSFGIGYRAQRDHHGFDVFGSIAKTWIETTTRVNVSYNYFFKPNSETQLFAGLGVGMKGVHAKKESASKCHVAMYPVLSIGQEFKTKTNCQRIVQVQIGWPVLAFGEMAKKTWTHRKSSYSVPYPTIGKISYVPEVIFSYGIGF